MILEYPLIVYVDDDYRLAFFNQPFRKRDLFKPQIKLEESNDAQEIIDES